MKALESKDVKLRSVEGKVSDPYYRTREMTLDSFGEFRHSITILNCKIV